jgi:hypothetical protein
LGPKAKVATALGSAVLASVLAPGVGVPLASWLGAFDQAESPPPVEAPDYADRDTYPGVVIERPDETPP